MTIDEALIIIKQSKECLIVWRTDTGEIVKVTNLDEKVTPENFVEHLSLMTTGVYVEETDKTIQYASQFRSSDNIDKKYLENQQDDFLISNLRVKLLNQWTKQSVNELILILETKNFPFPTAQSDTYILLERLFDFHWEEIGELEIKRLWRLVENQVLAEKDKNLLKFHLLFLEGKKAEFAEFYKQVFVAPFFYISSYIYYYIGDLQISDEYILKNYREILNNPSVLFGAKYPAMIALGKIGNASGEKSAQIIEEVIFDSNEAITKARNVVLKRIRTSGENWKRCLACRFGRLQGTYGDMITMQDCAECVGLGWVDNK